MKFGRNQMTNDLDIDHSVHKSNWTGGSHFGKHSSDINHFRTWARNDFVIVSAKEAGQMDGQTDKSNTAELCQHSLVRP